MRMGMLIMAAGAFITSCAATATSLPSTTTVVTGTSVTLGPITPTSTTATPSASPIAAVANVSARAVAVGATVGQPNAGCDPTGASAVIDRVQQRAWLCVGGTVTKIFPVTTARSQPDPGRYRIYAKDPRAWSAEGGTQSAMNDFVAFTHGKFKGARVAFHSVPKYVLTGKYEQPLSSVGDLARRGASAGCIRVLPDDATLLFDTLQIGDAVTVVN